MFTIVTANQKGGVGKTTTAAAVGMGLTLAGYRVLFVDADPQGNLTRMMATAPGLTLYSIIKEGREAKAAVQTVTGGSIIPSDARLAERGILTGRGAEYTIKTALKPLASKFDVCIIDTPPTLGALTVTALAAADGVIVPTKADRFSVDGLRTFAGTVAAIKQRTNPVLELLGVVVTAYNRNTNLNRAVLEALTAQAEQLGTKVYGTIRRTVAAEEWQYSGNVFGTPSTAADDYKEITAQIAQDIKKGAI